LNISGNKTIGEDGRLYSIISDPSSVLEELYMWSNKLSSNGTIKLFTGLSEGKKLRVLILNNYINITDKACDAIIMAMKKNSSLVELRMPNYPISEECAQFIIQALQHNSTLQLLVLPIGYSEDVKEIIRLLVEEVNKKRESHECQVKLEIAFQ